MGLDRLLGAFCLENLLCTGLLPRSRLSVLLERRCYFTLLATLLSPVPFSFFTALLLPTYMFAFLLEFLHTGTVSSGTPACLPSTFSLTFYT